MTDDVDAALNKIQKNFERFRNLCTKLGDRSEAVLAMVDDLADRIALCPASYALHLHNGFPGGLVEHSLRVLQNTIKLNKTWEMNIPADSLIISCLFHDFGKIGDLEQERYLEQDSNWHREKLGHMYKINKNIPIDPTGQGALFLLQHYGVKLKQDEYMAILLNDGMYADENRPYGMREPDLAMIVHHADVMASRWEKESGRSSL